MYVLSEDNVKKIATRKLAFDAVTQAFIAAYNGMGTIFPVVIACGCDDGNTMSLKSGNIKDQYISGYKSGSYWAKNHLKGIPNHSTTTILLDEETGVTRAVINAGYLNGLRTAAANAVATDKLARTDACVLGVLGAGHQSIFEIMAVCQVRSITKILISSRSEDSAKRAVEKLASTDMSVEVSDCETVCRTADILITVTNARSPLFEAGWVKNGTHVSAMGADQSGKQELPLALVNSACLFADLPSQSRAIGEFEVAAKENSELNITAIGAVLVGDVEGRVNNSQITIFDSSGIALQDLCVAKVVLDEAISLGLATEVVF